MTLIDDHKYIYNSTPPYEIIENKYMSKEELNEIHKVEATLEKFYNSGRFNNFWKFVRDNLFIKDYYQFFLDLYNFLESVNFSYLDYQIIDLFDKFDDFLKNNYNHIYVDIHNKLIIDYYSFFKVKPKTWRSAFLSKEEKQQLYPLFVEKLNGYTIEDLYRYANVLKLDNEYFIIFYKEHRNMLYFLNLE